MTVLVLATLAASGTLQLVLALAVCTGALLGWALWPLRELPQQGSPRSMTRGRSLRSAAGRRSRG
jgi:cytochrome c-type biogenesis protein CcmH/NrfG